MRIEAQRNPAQLRAEAQAYLDSTDWMVTRHAETGRPIPDDVKARRQAARETLNEVTP